MRFYWRIYSTKFARNPFQFLSPAPSKSEARDESIGYSRLSAESGRLWCSLTFSISRTPSCISSPCPPYRHNEFTFEWISNLLFFRSRSSRAERCHALSIGSSATTQRRTQIILFMSWRAATSPRGLPSSIRIHSSSPLPRFEKKSRARDVYAIDRLSRGGHAIINHLHPHRLPFESG